MKIGTPVVHLKRDAGPNDSTIYNLHAITWMEHTCFESDGYEELPDELEDEVFRVVLRIKQNGAIPNMSLLTPIVHTVALDTIDFGEANICVEVSVIDTSDNNCEQGKRKTHTDDAEDSTQPPPKSLN